MTTATAVTAQEAPAAAAADAARSHDRFFTAGASQVVDGHDAVLWQTLEQLTRSGKRFRPALLTRLDLKVGDEAVCVVKSTNVIVEIPSSREPRA